MTDTNNVRQYQGFTYPTASPTSGGRGACGGPAPSFAAASNSSSLVRRTTAQANGTSAASAASGGYGYFHRATSSGGQSGFAVSDTGSSHSNPMGTHHARGAGGAATTASAGFAYPHGPLSATSKDPYAYQRPSAVQVRVDSATPVSTNGYPLTPTVVVDTQHSSVSSTSPMPHARPSPWAAAAAATAGVGTVDVEVARGAAQPTPSSPAISFLPPTQGSAGGFEADTAAVQISGDSASERAERPYRPQRPTGPYSPNPAPFLAPLSTNGEASAEGKVGFGGRGTSLANGHPVQLQQQHVQQTYYPPQDVRGAVKPAGAGGGGGFFKDMLNRLLSDLDEPGAGGVSGDAQRRVDEARPPHQTRFGNPEDDLPLLEEIGIFPSHIWKKAKAVLNPFKPMPIESVEDTDLAGPLVFAVALAFLLSLQGKIQFSAIYGLSVLGVAGFKVLLTLMHSSRNTGNGGGSSSGVSAVSGAPIQFIISSLGYALLPSLVLALLRTFQYWLAGSFSTFLLPLAFLVITWSSWCSTSLLARGLNMEAQRYLILYPMTLFYSLFAALTIF